MSELVDGMVLYHGSYCEVGEPNLSKCANKKDFGKGFYLTSSKEQAKNFLKTSIIKASMKGEIDSGQDYGYISTFKIKTNPLVTSYFFDDANKEWLHCVASNRKDNCFAEIRKKFDEYDVVVGKIADDATNATLTAYLAGAFGEIGSEIADDFCIKQLLPNNLKDQYCFKSERALESLIFEGSEKIWIK